MFNVIAGKIKRNGISARMYTSKILENTETAGKFETVFSFPFIKYLAVFNRLKTYHLAGSSIAIPGCGLLEMLNILPHQSFLSAAYIVSEFGSVGSFLRKLFTRYHQPKKSLTTVRVHFVCSVRSLTPPTIFCTQQQYTGTKYQGITGAAVLSVTSWPFNNTIGFIYISEDNKQIKISSVNFWGNRVNRVVPVDDWIPLFDIEPRKSDMFFLSPRLADNTRYKWFVKFGNVINSNKIGQILE